MERVITYLIHRIDEGLNIVPFQTPNNIGYFLPREDYSDKGYKFTLRNGTVDQALQGLFIRGE